MAASLASIAKTWPENVLTSIVSRKSLTRKIIAHPNNEKTFGSLGFEMQHEVESLR